MKNGSQFPYSALWPISNAIMSTYMMYEAEQRFNKLSAEGMERLLVTCGISESSSGDYKLAVVVIEEYTSPNVAQIVCTWTGERAISQVLRKMTVMRDGGLVSPRLQPPWPSEGT